MSRFDLASFPIWVLAAVMLVPLAALGYWAQSTGAPANRFETELPDRETTQTNEPDVEFTPKDFSSLVLIRPPEDKGVLGMAADVLPPELLAQVERTIGGDTGDWHLVAIERQRGELVAILFYKDEIKSLTAAVGEKIHDHTVDRIDATGVTLKTTADQPIRLELKEELPST